jgi:hypothetical protein
MGSASSSTGAATRTSQRTSIPPLLDQLEDHAGAADLDVVGVRADPGDTLARPNHPDHLGRLGCLKPTRQATRREAGSGGDQQLLFEPGLAAEVAILLGTEPVRESAWRQLDVVVAKHVVAGDVPE